MKRLLAILLLAALALPALAQTPVRVRGTIQSFDGQTLTVNGIAQSNERVSEFLRNTANNSEWLVKPELVEIKASNVQTSSREQKRLFDFSMRLAVKRPQDKAPEAAPAKAASTPAATSKKA